MLGLGAAMLSAACGGEPLEFADWTIPVPEGTPIHEYAAVPDAERAGNELDLQRDLVIGGGGRGTAPTEEHIAQVMEGLQDRNEALTRQMVNWPAQYPVIQGLVLDGAGRLYVVPFRYRAPDDEAPAAPEPVPVDVYTPDGERVFAGLMAIPSWSAARGDHVYRMETDDAGDQIVVRYRIATRF